MGLIRFAQDKDIPSLVEAGLRMHALTRFRPQTYDAQKVAKTLADLIERGQGKYLFLVAENSHGQVVGGLIGVIERPIFSAVPNASVVYYDVLPEARMGGYGIRLLKAFEQWAANRDVREINFGINSVNDEAELARLTRFAHRMGYSTVGANFSKPASQTR